MHFVTLEKKQFQKVEICLITLCYQGLLLLPLHNISDTFRFSKFSDIFTQKIDLSIVKQNI